MVNCIFCQIVSGNQPAEIIYRDEICLAFMDIRPRTRGHFQVIPVEHYRWIYESDRMGEIFATVGRLVRGIIPILKADHVTLATLGHEIEHAHIWVMPQYSRIKDLVEGGRENQKHDIHQVADLIRQNLREEVSLQDT